MTYKKKVYYTKKTYTELNKVNVNGFFQFQHFAVTV